MTMPSREIPDGLSAQQYYELGLQFRLAGWVGLARESLFKALKMQSTGPIAVRSEKVLRTQLPRLPVSEAAEQRNIEGYNLMDTDPNQAAAIFQELMNKYPDFEWPFSNLAWIKLQQGDIAGAKGLAKYLLSVNPDHLRSINLMMNISLAERNYDEAIRFIDRTLELYPHDEEYTRLKIGLKIGTKGPPPDTIPEDLSALDYYNLATEYQMVGRFENARRSIERAIQLDGPNGLVSSKATRFLKSQLPKDPVSVEVEACCAEVASKSSVNADEVKPLLQKLIEEHPNFEWPYMMLASMHFMDKSVSDAEKLLRHVVSINPDYAEARLLLISLNLSENKIPQALDLINQSLPNVESDDEGLHLDLLKAQCMRQESEL